MNQKIGKDEIGNCLALLSCFSMQFMYEIMTKAKDYLANDLFQTFFAIDNILLIMVPILIYLFLKAKGPFLKFIYLLSILPFLLTSSVFCSLNIECLSYFNIVILLILIGCLMRYINQRFELYKNQFEEGLL